MCQGLKVFKKKNCTYITLNLDVLKFVVTPNAFLRIICMTVPTNLTEVHIFLGKGGGFQGHIFVTLPKTPLDLYMIKMRIQVICTSVIWVI